MTEYERGFTEGRKQALEEAARDCEEAAAICFGRAANVILRAQAVSIRALLNQGRDEVATSPEITRERALSARPPTDTEAK